MSGQTGPKLNPTGVALVIQSVIAGSTNNEIRKKLADAGYVSNLSDNAFSKYRQSKTVKEALQRKEEEAVQSGLSLRSERILKLVKHANRFERRLAYTPDDPEFVHCKPLDLSLLSKEYRETIKDIGTLVDPKDTAPPPTQTVEIILSAASNADIKFSRLFGPNAGESLLGQPDDSGESGT